MPEKRTTDTASAKFSPAFRNAGLGVFAVGIAVVVGAQQAAPPGVGQEGSTSSISGRKPADSSKQQDRWSFPLAGDQVLHLVRIEPTTYMRGSSPEQYGVAVQMLGLDSEAGKVELPQHQIMMSKPFLVSEAEVTVGQFKAFVDETGYVTTAEKEGDAYIWRGDKVARTSGSWRSPGYPQTDEHPVVCVSWYDADTFVTWLNSKTDQVKFALPTEAEFELVLRAGSEDQFYWGDGPEGVKGLENVKDSSGNNAFGWTPSFSFSDGHAWPAPVRSYQPNDYGVYDLGGNVFEWCSDWFAPYSDEALTDPKGPLIGNERVYRGGGWRSSVSAHRSSARWGYNPVNRSNTLGFRVVARPNS
ncbi:formylglycine-generating enzyme family protein [soil metagenome]